MTFQFDWFTLVFAFIIIFYLILGIAKGVGHLFMNHIMAYIIILVSLVLAAMIGPVIGSVTGLGNLFKPNIQALLESASSVFETSNPGREIVAEAIKASDYAALTAVGIPAFIGPFFLAVILPNIPVEATTTPISEYIAETLITVVFIFVAFLIFNTVLGIIHEIIKSKSKKKQKKEKEEGIYKKPNGFSRFLGAVVGAFVGFITIYITLWFFKAFLLPIDQLNSYFNYIWALDDPTIFTIGKWLYTNNPVNSFLLWIFKLFNI